MPELRNLDLFLQRQDAFRLLAGGVLLLGLGAFALRAFLRGTSRRLPPAENGPGAPAAAVLAACAVYLGCMWTVSLVLPLPSADPVARIQGALRTSLAALACAGAAGVLACRRPPGPAKALGLTLHAPLFTLVLAPLTWVVLWPALLGVATLRQGIHSWMGRELATQELLDTIRHYPELLAVPWITASLAVVQPFLEEVLFRGVLLSFLLTRLRPGAAIVVGALLFALVHDAGRELVFVLGLALCWWYARTRSLLGPCLLHMIHNSFTLYVYAGSASQP